MDAREMRDLTEQELAARITTLRKDLFGLRFANATGELEDTAGIGRARRDLARALTVSRERVAVTATEHEQND
jgi:large subunit ribosomal protein L29